MDLILERPDASLAERLSVLSPAARTELRAAALRERAAVAAARPVSPLPSEEPSVTKSLGQEALPEAAEEAAGATAATQAAEEMAAGAAILQPAEEEQEVASAPGSAAEAAAPPPPPSAVMAETSVVPEPEGPPEAPARSPPPPPPPPLPGMLAKRAAAAAAAAAPGGTAPPAPPLLPGLSNGKVPEASPGTPKAPPPPPPLPKSGGRAAPAPVQDTPPRPSPSAPTGPYTPPAPPAPPALPLRRAATLPAKGPRPPSLLSPAVLPYSGPRLKNLYWEKVEGVEGTVWEEILRDESGLVSRLQSAEAQPDGGPGPLRSVQDSVDALGQFFAQAEQAAAGKVRGLAPRAGAPIEGAALVGHK